MIELDLGADLGTTTTKLAALDDEGRIVCEVSEPTTWHEPQRGWAERDPEAVVGSVDRLLGAAAARARDRLAGAVRFRSLGFTSMAETGSLLDADGRARSPHIAWYDPRGGAEAARLPSGVRDEISSRTGMSVDAQATVFKLLWMRAQGMELRGLQWLGVPELVCLRLGAVRVAERSIRGRTGLVDLHTGRPAAIALELLGVDEGILPPVVGSGAAVGRVRADHPVDEARGAVLTIAGHDHLVAAAAAGAARAGAVLDSMGTSEAFAAAADHVPEPGTMLSMTRHDLSVYPHVIADTVAIIGGTRSGIVLKRVLGLLGAESPAGRAALEAAAATLDPARTDVEVTGCRMLDHDVRVVVEGETVGPGAVWNAAVRATAAEARRLLEDLRRHGIAVDELVLAGGWSLMDSLVRARRDLAPTVRRDATAQPGIRGAARIGRWALRHDAGTDPGGHPSPPADYVAGSGSGAADDPPTDAVSERNESLVRQRT